MDDRMRYPPSSLSAHDLASELGVECERLRDWRRSEYPDPAADHDLTSHLSPAQVEAARRHFGDEGAQESGYDFEARQTFGVRSSPQLPR
jgi:hypothetical protein